ncbi:uncharacterized protein EV420DRAFT_1767192 [Desarmillaria tabescens]|uniref:F-box domain-containing protein n=1 Tax=Armillaria tabescens TaxID=1929756 RepID=A0AA39JU43_ARMTA|nr:uncharacterized protein EV420DRAFT_1767192 [Desarmillaria tabescens]KAK0448942.1 hypothetical protein EV420DRAFT_1767192 [Desarmillaria tabescens]
MTMQDNISVASDSCPSLPQELVDYILDFLHDDIPVLRTCSLVSNGFLPRSRHHIYSGVLIVHDMELDSFREQHAGKLYRCGNFDALLKHSPHVGPLVRTLGMHTMSERLDDLCAYSSLHSIFHSLHNLSQLQLVDQRDMTIWNFLPIVFRELFLTTLRSSRITTLQLKGIAYATNNELEDVFTAVANPVLKHLSIDSDFGEKTSSTFPLTIRQPANGLPELESLSMSGDSMCHQIEYLFFNRSLYNVSHVRQLSLQLSSDTTGSVVQSLLDEMRDTLECLTLDVTHYADQNNGFDLRRHKKLTSFYSVLFFTLNTWLLTIWFGPALQSLTTELLVDDWVIEPDAPTLTKVDAHIDKLALPMLQHAHVKLHDISHNVCSYFWCDGDYLPPGHDEWRNQVEEQMPLLSSKRILEVDVVKQRYCVARANDSI